MKTFSFNHIELRPQPRSRSVICEMCENRILEEDRESINIRCKKNGKLYYGVMVDNDGMVINRRVEWRCENGYSYDNFH